MPYSIVLVEKTGELKSAIAANQEIETLLKKTGSKSIKGFELQTTWTMGDGSTIQLYAKQNGKAGLENKYEFPPPVDEILYFGTCVLIRPSGQLTVLEWTKIYEKLHGGFRDIGDEAVEEEDEDDFDILVPQTKSGFAKDGFVVSDDDESSLGDEEDQESVGDHSCIDDDEDSIPPPTSSKKKIASKKNSKSGVGDKNTKLVPSSSVLEPTTYWDCTEELCVEKFV